MDTATTYQPNDIEKEDRPLEKPRPQYNDGVLIGNWVENRMTCPKNCNLYFAPEEKIDYKKMKPESRQQEFRLNKLVGTSGNIPYAIKHDSYDGCNNFVTTNDLVYRYLPQPLCGPVQRVYRKAPHQFAPQPDLMQFYGKKTEFGLRKYKNHEWLCTDVSDYNTSLYDDTYVAPRPNQYLQVGERLAKNSRFTKTFLHKMQIPKPKPTKINKPK